MAILGGIVSALGDSGDVMEIVPHAFSEDEKTMKRINDIKEGIKQKEEEEESIREMVLGL